MWGGSNKNLELGVCVVEACVLEGVCEEILGGLYFIITGGERKFRINRKIWIIRYDLNLNLRDKK